MEFIVKKLKVNIIFVLISIVTVFLCSVSYSAFYDLSYPPNSNGKADYTDAEADTQKDDETKSSPEEYIGKSSNNYLKSLTIENAIISPEFNRQYVEYTLKLKDENDRKIKIVAEAEDKNAKVQGTGEIELKPGIGSTRVVVTAENGDVQIYNFTIDSPYAGNEVQTEETESTEIISKEDEQVKKQTLKSEWIIVVVVFIIIIISIVVIKFKTKK